MSNKKRNELFALTAERRGMRSGAIVEKDLWGTWVLGRRLGAVNAEREMLSQGDG